jgi:hypothetical protein
VLDLLHQLEVNGHSISFAGCRFRRASIDQKLRSKN